MEIWVSSRTKSEDYTWRTFAGCGGSSPSPQILGGYDQWKFEDCVPWFGMETQEGVSTLYFGNLLTDREDSRGRPIFVHAVLRAIKDKERRRLFEVVASLLVGERELLPQWSAYLLSIFDSVNVSPYSLPTPSTALTPSVGDIGRYVYPRGDMATRRLVATRLLATSPDCPFAVGTTGRSGNGIFERVCNSEGKWQAAFFSGTCVAKSELVPKASCPDFPLIPSRPKLTGKKIVLMAVLAVAVVWVIAKLWPTPTTTSTDLPKTLETTSGR